MDSNSQLDYALFQLTPTRTRCDLVICVGDCKEKLASGLLQPFISHLKYAKDEISKGGYSVTLSAPAPWFTKSTLERFVRFVSTPEVLERFVTIEREIVNIDSSINTIASSDSQNGYELDEHSDKSANLRYKHEGNTNDAVHDEDSKVHLQRVLETRKAVLQREQAMVYARALIAGFEMDNLQDLICFADAFGSPRLREACLNFIELCNTKSNDRVWMDEVAAMEAYSCSHYSYTDDPGQGLRINIRNGNFTPKKHNGSVDSPTTDSSISHGSHLPQYMHTYQTGPMFQPPYQGIAVPPFYQGNLPWPPNVEDSKSRRKRSHKKGSRDMAQDGNVNSSDSNSGSESDSYKRSSSRKVVIRNINYITPARDGKTGPETNGNSSNNDVNKGKTFKDKHEGQKVTQQWDIFQNLLMKDSDDNEADKSTNIIPSGIRPEFASKSSTIGKHGEGDWFLGSLPGKAIQEKSRDIFEDNIKSIKNTKDVLVKDPLAVQAKSFNQSSDSQLKTRDILMVSESNRTQREIEAAERNDLYMVLERDTSNQKSEPAWTPEMESGNSNLKIIKPDPVKDSNSRTKTPVRKGIEREGSTIEAKSNVLTGSRSKKSTATKTTIPKGKTEKDEEKRKKMEELLAQRQKRIAERSASATKTAKTDRPKPQPASHDKKKSNKPVLRSSTTDRLSVARVVSSKVLPTESRPGNKPMKVATKKKDEPKPGNKPMKAATKKNAEPKPVSKPTRVTTKENVFSRTSLTQRTAGADKKKVKPDSIKPLDKRISSKNLNGPKKMIADVNNIKQLPKESPIKKIGNRSAQPAKTNGVNAILHKTSSVLAKDKAVSDGNGGSANKALNSVSFSLNEENGAKQNPIVKVNSLIPVKEISPQPPLKVSPEESNSKKKWNSLQTTSKALSGFRKLLSFGRS